MTCPDCGAETDDIGDGCCGCRLDAACFRDRPVEGMRAMAARRWGARSPGLAALLSLTQYQRAATVDLAEGRPIGQRIASTLRRKGMVLPGDAPDDTRPRLTPLGAEVARLQASRNRSGKEDPRASQPGE